MSRDAQVAVPARRSFLSRLGLGAAALGAWTGIASPAAAQSAAFEPAKHPDDDWMERLPGKHRLVIDTTSPAGSDDALKYASNFFTANKSGYNLAPADLAVIVVMRHFATPFAYTDAVWQKYGQAISDEITFVDPKTKAVPATNLRTGAVDGLVNQGAHFAVCGMATRYFAGVVAKKTGQTEDVVYKDLTSNLVRNAHIVSAGIVAVNRAQERGYSFAYGG